MLQFRLAGPFALGRGESSQIRKEAATAVLLKCRSQARHTFIKKSTTLLFLAIEDILGEPDNILKTKSQKSGGIEPSLFLIGFTQILSGAF